MAVVKNKPPRTPISFAYGGGNIFINDETNATEKIPNKIKNIKNPELTAASIALLNGISQSCAETFGIREIKKIMKEKIAIMLVKIPLLFIVHSRSTNF